MFPFLSNQTPFEGRLKFVIAILEYVRFDGYFKKKNKEYFVNDVWYIKIGKLLICFAIELQPIHGAEDNDMYPYHICVNKKVLIEAYTGGKIISQYKDSDDAMNMKIYNAFVTKSGVLIGDICDAWEWYKKRYVIDELNPKEIALIQNKYRQSIGYVSFNKLGQHRFIIGDNIIHKLYDISVQWFPEPQDGKLIVKDLKEARDYALTFQEQFS